MKFNIFPSSKSALFFYKIHFVIVFNKFIIFVFSWFVEIVNGRFLVRRTRNRLNLFGAPFLLRIRSHFLGVKENVFLEVVIDEHHCPEKIVICIFLGIRVTPKLTYLKQTFLHQSRDHNVSYQKFNLIIFSSSQQSVKYLQNLIHLIRIDSVWMSDPLFFLALMKFWTNRFFPCLG